MKKILCFALLACFVASMAFAVETPTKIDKAVTLKGDIIDNMCAGAQKSQLSTFVKTHTKECALQCAASGYSIFSDGKLSKFDKASNPKIEEFLKKPDTKLQVVIVAEPEGKELDLVSIENQK